MTKVQATWSQQPPAWVEVSLDAKEGRDPLGLQTTTQDRLMPVLLPGMLELTRRARYFAFYAFLLDEYRDRRLAADPKSQSMFIRRREWDLGGRRRHHSHRRTSTQVPDTPDTEHQRGGSMSTNSSSPSQLLLVRWDVLLRELRDAPHCLCGAAPGHAGWLNRAADENVRQVAT